MTHTRSRLSAALLAACVSVPLLVTAPASASPALGSPALGAPAVGTTPAAPSGVSAGPVANGDFSANRITRYTKKASRYRTGPGTNYRVAGVYPSGRKLSGTMTRSGWLKVGTHRYIAHVNLTTKRTTGTQLLTQGRRYFGIMYRYGGNSPSEGFDCSGYTQYVFGRLGYSLPRTVAGQKAASTKVRSPRKGDLVFWGSYHAAIYAGNGYIYDSGKPGLPVQKRRMFSGVTSYGRVL